MSFKEKEKHKRVSFKRITQDQREEKVIQAEMRKVLLDDFKCFPPYEAIREVFEDKEVQQALQAIERVWGSNCAPEGDIAYLLHDFSHFYTSQWPMLLVEKETPIDATRSYLETQTDLTNNPHSFSTRVTDIYEASVKEGYTVKYIVAAYYTRNVEIQLSIRIIPVKREDGSTEIEFSVKAVGEGNVREFHFTYLPDFLALCASLVEELPRGKPKAIMKAFSKWIESVTSDL